MVTAIEEYHRGDRKTAPMKSVLRDASKLDLESLALYYASQTPAQRPAPSVGDAAAGEPRSGMCGGCHGPRGVSRDAATPSLAGQDPQYAGSVLAHGVIDNLTLTVRSPAIQEFHGSFRDGIWQVSFIGQTNYFYQLQSTDDWKTWTSVGAQAPGKLGERLGGRRQRGRKPGKGSGE